MRTRTAVSQKADTEMSVLGHLKELRNRLIIITVILLCFTGGGFYFADEIVKHLIGEAKALGYELIYIAPAELLTEYLRLSLIAGLILTSPVILQQLWLFLKPGLEKKERKAVQYCLLFGLLCFTIGAVFAYFVTLPFMLRFFISLDRFQSIAATISIRNYLSFLLSMLITFGLVFEMPVLSYLLTEFKILNPLMLKKSRRVVIVICFIFGAIITPTDILSQILVSIPMLFLFEISVVICRITFRKNKHARIPEKDMA